MKFRALILLPLLAGCAAPTPDRQDASTAAPQHYDLLIRNSLLYDGSGAPPQRIDLAVRGDRVSAWLAPGTAATAETEVDAGGRALAPGFINVLSWATESLIADGRGMSDTKQGITLEIFGEGWSMGPLNPAMKALALKEQGDIKYAIEWTTLGEYLDYLQQRGVTPNIASFVGATTVRMHELAEANRAPSPEELARMQELVRAAMREGALGVGASLIYAPAFYAQPDELVSLSRAAAEYGGGYVAHLRSEANRFLEALDETIALARATGQRAEVYHLKAAGRENWPKMAKAIAKIEAARGEGLPVSANMYAYTAGATGLDASMPPWVQEGGTDAWVSRLKDPAIRARVRREISTPAGDWENLFLLAGSAELVKFIGFKSEALKPLTGQTLAEVARARGTSPEDTMIDLVIEDHSRVETAYFLMSEDNVRLGLRQPWVSLGSDAESSAPEGVFLQSSTHPRAYGNVARFLGHYVRDEGLVPLPDAIRRLTRLPAQNWKLKDRGCIDPGCYADLVLFDPATIADRASFDQPQQYAVGVSDVWVNGIRVLRDGEHTGAKPGRVVRGPGWQGRNGDVGASLP